MNSTSLHEPSFSSISESTYFESPDLDTSSDEEEDLHETVRESQFAANEVNREEEGVIEPVFVFNPEEELVVINSSRILNARDTLRSYLAGQLKTNYSTVIKSQNFGVKCREKQIEISENRLINECLILLSGCKLSIMFEFTNGEFHFNHKFRLKYLNIVLDDCLETICRYSRIVLRIQDFVNKCTNGDNEVSHVYEVFAQCLNDYIKYFNKRIGIVADVLAKKELTFTLVDFIEYLKTPYFSHFDVLNELLDQISNDEGKENCEKSMNLIVRLYRQLVDSYSVQQNTHSNRSVFLVWLFTNLLKFHLKSIEHLLKEGLLVDTKNEFGFKRNTEIQIQDPNYWTKGYTFIFTSISYLQNLPVFLRCIIVNTFKLCKYIQIIKLFNNRELYIQSTLYEKFRKFFEKIFHFLYSSENSLNDKSTTDLANRQDVFSNLLELNFKNIKLNIIQGDTNLNVNADPLTLDTLFNNDFKDNKTFSLNIETEIDNFVSDSLNVYTDLISNILIKNLIENYHLFTYIEQLQSYSLFKTNETMFLFSKDLFELIKFYETYQDEMILNKILYHSSVNNQASSAGSNQQAVSHQKLFKIIYENTNVNKVISKGSPVRQQRGMNISTRLISGIKLKFHLNWPFNMIIHEEDVEIYNKFFMLILQMKQVKYDLDSLDFKDLDIESKTKETENDESDDERHVSKGAIKKMFLMRFKLINFINTIHDLLCHQVYQLSDEFQECLRKLNDIDDILDLHKKFLAKMNANSLSQNKYFANALLQIFDFILRYCDRWRRGIYAITNEIASDFEQEISNHFLFMSNLLSSAINRNQLLHLQPLIAVLLYTAFK